MLFEGKDVLALWAMTDLLCGSWVKRESKLTLPRAAKSTMLQLSVMCALWELTN